MHAGLCWRFHNPLKSDMDYSICNVRMLSFCMCTHTGGPQFITQSHSIFFYIVCTEFDSREISGWVQSQHVMFTHSFGDHARACFTLVLPLTLLVVLDNKVRMLHCGGLTGVFSIFEVFKQSHQLILVILCPWNLCGAEKKIQQNSQGVKVSTVPT